MRKKIYISIVAFFGLIVLAGCSHSDKVQPIGNQPSTPPPTNTGKTDDGDDAIKKEEVMEDDGAMKKDADKSLASNLDGTHDLAVTYEAPPGEELINISLTVENGVVTSASATPTATHEVSVKMQTGFASSFSAAVIGKEIKDLEVDVIGGASLATGGFNAAVANLQG